MVKGKDMAEGIELVKEGFKLIVWSMPSWAVLLVQFCLLGTALRLAIEALINERERLK